MEKFFLNRNVEKIKKHEKKRKTLQTQHKKQKIKGVGRMPWHYMTKKDVTTCEKLRRVGSGHRLADIRMGQPTASKVAVSSNETNS